MVNDSSCKIHSVSIYNLDNTLDKVLHFSQNIFSHTCSSKGYKYLSDSGHVLDTSNYHITHNLHSEHNNDGNTHYDAHLTLGGGCKQWGEHCKDDGSGHSDAMCCKGMYCHEMDYTCQSTTSCGPPCHDSELCCEGECVGDGVCKCDIMTKPCPSKAWICDPDPASPSGGTCRKK